MWHEIQRHKIRLDHRDSVSTVNLSLPIQFLGQSKIVLSVPVSGTNIEPLVDSEQIVFIGSFFMFIIYWFLKEYANRWHWKNIISFSNDILILFMIIYSIIFHYYLKSRGAAVVFACNRYFNLINTLHRFTV